MVTQVQMLQVLYRTICQNAKYALADTMAYIQVTLYNVKYWKHFIVLGHKEVEQKLSAICSKYDLNKLMFIAQVFEAWCHGVESIVCSSRIFGTTNAGQVM